MAYYAYQDMWAEIDAITYAAGNTLTVYVDDVTLSGTLVRTETVWAIKETLTKHGHRTKARKEETHLGTAVVVTGVVLRDDALLLPNVQHLKRYRIRKALERMPEGPERLHAQAVLAGHEETERQILARNW